MHRSSRFFLCFTLISVLFCTTTLCGAAPHLHLQRLALQSRTLQYVNAFTPQPSKASISGLKTASSPQSTPVGAPLRSIDEQLQLLLIELQSSPTNLSLDDLQALVNVLSQEESDGATEATVSEVMEISTNPSSTPEHGVEPISSQTTSETIPTLTPTTTIESTVVTSAADRSKESTVDVPTGTTSTVKPAETLTSLEGHLSNSGQNGNSIETAKKGKTVIITIAIVIIILLMLGLVLGLVIWRMRLRTKTVRDDESFIQKQRISAFLARPPTGLDENHENIARAEMGNADHQGPRTNIDGNIDSYYAGTYDDDKLTDADAVDDVSLSDANVTKPASDDAYPDRQTHYGDDHYYQTSQSQDPDPNPDIAEVSRQASSSSRWADRLRSLRGQS